jgi:aryl-alcohol dehydrogenase-like predicted oxidoreductase
MKTILPHRKLGKLGSDVSALGLGCMGMSDLYGPADRVESIATGDFYGKRVARAAHVQID